MIQFIRKYKHGLVIAIYSLIYILLFRYLETRPVTSYHIVHTVFDDMIPFCEYFIIPYMLWFPYMILAVVYFIFYNKNKHEYYQLAFNLMMGMTIFLIVSYIYPNAQHLRPTEFPRDNFFTHAVQ
ncbi:MAG: phosphoesterase, partial [Clostridia bacterium]|nr:phosphoesterase [Clostridia bacterium]MDY5555061.1 phosphoesterase [Blautia sp.]